MTPIEVALMIATHAHGGQKRKSNRGQGSKTALPYIVHPVEVMTFIRHAGCDNEVVLAAALLHDVIEDTQMTRALLAQSLLPALPSQTTATIVAMVSALTKNPLIPKEKQHTEVLDRLCDPDTPVECRGIKMADRLSNLRSLNNLPWTFGRKMRYVKQAKDIADLVCIGDPGAPGAQTLPWIHRLSKSLTEATVNTIIALDSGDEHMRN